MMAPIAVMAQSPADLDKQAYAFMVSGARHAEALRHEVAAGLFNLAVVAFSMAAAARGAA